MASSKRAMWAGFVAAVLLAQCSQDPVAAEQSGGTPKVPDNSPGPLTDPVPTPVPTPATTPATIPATIPTALEFDRNARLEFDDDPDDVIFNFYSRGAIDMLICPSGGAGASAEDDSRFHQALVTCADDEAAATRYGIFLLGDLDGLGFWNGSSWWRIDHDFQPDTWAHLTVVFARGWTTFAVNGEAIGVIRAPIGKPIDPSDPAGRKLQFCRTYVGGTNSGHDGFNGRIAWVRTWRTALSMDHVARLPGIIGAPTDPVLAQCLAACSSFTAESQTMQRSSVTTRASVAENAKGMKREQVFTRKIPWLFSLEQAKQAAAQSKRRILAWSTRGDAYDPACLAIEGTLLGGDLWGSVQDRVVPLLLVGTTANRQPNGVRAGFCALLDAEGRVQRSFVPWSSEFFAAMEQDVAEASADGKPNEARARQLLLRPAAMLNAAQLSELTRLAASGDLSDEMAVRIGDAEKVAAILKLQASFRQGAGLAPENGEPLTFEDAQYLYDQRALELFADLKLPLEPDRRLADFAVLLWRGLVEDPRLDLVQDALDFLVPMRALDPVVDAVMTAEAMDPGVESEDLKKILEKSR